jgi:hypothetical protein
MHLINLNISHLFKTLGKDFCELWHTLKLAEHQCIYNKMTLSEKIGIFNCFQFKKTLQVYIVKGFF